MYSKESLQKRRAKLSSEKLAFLQKRLRGQPDTMQPNHTIPRRPDTRLAPLSFLQERLWFLFEWEPDRPTYNEAHIVRYKSSLDVRAFAAAHLEIMRRHEILRTTYQYLDGEAVQVVVPTTHWFLPLIDLTSLPRKVRETEAQTLAQEEANRPFDLRQDYSWRITLIRMAPDDYISLTTQHHISCDGWSLKIRYNELTSLYAAYTVGKPSPLPELTIQYADYAYWQRQQLQGVALEKMRTYWREKLADLTPLQMPTDRSRPPVLTSNGAAQQTSLTVDLAETIRQFSQQEKVTTFMIGLAAFKALLYHYTGQTDIAIGSTVANRDLPELEELIGFLVETIVLRTDLSGNPTFRELLHRVYRGTLEAYAHKALPFGSIIADLQGNRDPSRMPLVQILFEWQDWHALSSGENELADLKLNITETRRVPTDTAKFDLELLVERQGEEFVCLWEYNTDLFDSSTITRMIQHYQTLLAGVLANPDVCLSDLPLLTEDEQQLQRVWNDTSVDYPYQQYIHELFEAQAQQTPDAIAVIFENQALTYQELNNRANQLAHYLCQMGVRPEVGVGINIERSLEMVVGLYGILKAGGAYVPLDPTYPPARLAFMVEDAQVSVLLTQEKLLPLLPPHAAQTIVLDADWETIAQQSVQNLTSQVTADNLAYTIYTSGSTGVPKGAMNTHSGIRNRLLWMQETYQLTDTDRVMQKTPFSFDVSVWEFFWPLLNGASLVVARPEGHKEPAYLANLIAEQCITTMHFVPSMLQAFIEEPAINTCHSLKRIICSGEALPFDLQERFFARFDQVELHNLYGPTEAAVDVTFWMCDRQSHRSTVPIGRPIANTQIYLLDTHLNPVPVGIPAELYIGGHGLARGYLNRAALTAEKFVPSPFGAVGGMRLYKTGDLAHYLPDGAIEFLGRIDHQVKIRGFRIELGEIEAILRQHPAIREVVVVVQETAREIGDKQLVAYLVPNQGQILSTTVLRHYLIESLPDYMIPVAFVVLETLPLTPNGKIDRNALPKLDASRRTLVIKYTPPRDSTEEILANIWADVLRLEQVGIHDNFFELGGHSLLATQVISRIREAFSIELSLHDLFASPTIASLKKDVEMARFGEQNRSIMPISPISRDGNLPLSFAQQRLWFMDQLASGLFTYNTFSTLNLAGQLNISVLAQALNEIVRRHEILRTTFSNVEGEPIQLITPYHPFFLPLVDLSLLPDVMQAEVGRQIAREAANRPFDLEGAVFRFSLLRLGNTEHVLLLSIRHIASDAWSEGILIDELTVLYEAYLVGQPSSLPALPIQYVDYAAWQQAWLQGDALEIQATYWKQQLAGVPAVLALPTDRPRSIEEASRGALQPFTLSESLSEGLNQLSRQEGVTLFMTLLAAFQVLLYRYSGQEDFLIGTLMAGRNRTEIERLIGLFLNTAVLRADLSGNPDFRTLLKQIRETVLGAYAHQDFPLEKLVQTLQPDRNLDRAPLFQVMFLLQNIPTRELSSLTELEITRAWDIADEIAKVDLLLTMGDTGKQLMGSLEYRLDLFDATTIQRMLKHFETLLEHIVANPKQPVATLPILSEIERQQLLLAWNENEYETAYPKDRCLQALFEAQVEKTPDAVAVLCADTQLTYSKLNAEANRLAHFLVAQGIGPDTIVALLVERNLDFLVGMLAIFKAGAAYLPLTADDPASRLGQILQQSQVQFVLTVHKFEPLLLPLADQPPTHQPQVYFVEDIKTANQSTKNLSRWCSPTNLAYVIYTSGSTGVPKGAALAHDGMVNHLYAKIADLMLTEKDKVAQTARQTFDISVWQFLAALLVGGQVHIFDNETATDPVLLLHQVQEKQISVLEIVPSLLQVILDEAALNGADELDLSRLRWLMVTGEAVPPKLCQKWLRHYSDIPMMNAYGPTECSDDVTHYPIHHPPEPQVLTVPIGRPIANIQIYILDKQWQPVPRGVVGELFVGGAGVGRGYLNNVAQTAESFIPNPFTQQAGARLYKTGDKGRYLPDGNIEFLGRLDYQAKVRGFRIELGEIEAVLRQHPAIRETVVMVWEAGSDQRHLVAYITPHQKPAPGSAILRDFLKERLPDYMVPPVFITLDAFPLTRNGKIDRKALPEPEGTRLDLQDTYVAPRTPTEEVLTEIWATVLKIDRVGSHDNFFDLGGHSLLATQIIARIQKAFEVALPLRQLFETPTVSGLAGFIERDLREERGLQVQPILPVARDAQLPLSFAQQRLWFLEQWEPDSPTYNISEMSRTKGSLDLKAVERAYLEIAHRHEILRTTYQYVDDQPIQVIAPSISWSLPVIDLGALSPEVREAEVQRLAKQEAQRPFNLQHDLPWRITLARLSKEDHVTLVTQHHIACDAWSIQIRNNEFRALYAAFTAGKPSPLPELSIQYADFAYWQQERLQGPMLDTLRAYWQQQLAHIKPLQLPTDRPRPTVATTNGAIQQRILPPSFIKAIETLCRQEGATSFMVGVAALNVLLFRYTNETDIAIGSSFSIRDQPELEGLIGFFIDTIILRTDLAENPTFRELLRQVRQVTLEAHIHKELPVDHIIADMQAKRDLSRNLLVQVLLEWQDWRSMSVHESNSSSSDLEEKAQDIGVPTNTAKFDLALFVEIQDEGIGCHWEYNTDLFNDSTIARLSGHFQTLLDGALTHPDMGIAELPLLSTEEQHQILHEWNETAVSHPPGLCVHELFEAQVGRTPDAVAVVFEDQCLTYDELNQRANQLAGQLQSLGIGPERGVGVCMERTPEMIVGLLGVLKAGGAYVPLDPLFPPERVTDILEDVQASVLLTQPHLLAGFSTYEGHTICLDTDSWPVAPGPVAPVAAGVYVDNLAYVIYTSGSTGKPKGVAVPHSALVNYTHTARRDFKLGPADRVLQFASISFDTAAEEIFPCLTTGAALVLRTEAVFGLAVTFLRTCQEWGITVLDLPTAYWHELAASLDIEGVQYPEKVRLVIIGGERALKDRVVKWQTYIPPSVRLMNTYGPTEATIVAVATDLTTAAEEEAEVPIGHPISNVQVYILDAHLQPMPMGIPGELYIGGAGLARAYVNRAGLTAQSFIPHPFSAQPGARLYKTGDQARYRPDGCIEFVGRMDSQVKIRGYRVEPGEVEAKLLEYPAVQEAVVMVREDTPDNKYLVAYVVAETTTPLIASDLRHFLQQTLPDYMLPAATMVMDALPLTPSGKIDRQALPAPDHVRPELESAYVAPRTLSEEMLADIWSQVLGVDRVGVLDNFFELGGHSMLAIQLMAQLQAAFEVELSLRLFFQWPTIAELAVAIDEILLKEIEELSEDEVLQLLADEL